MAAQRHRLFRIDIFPPEVVDPLMMHPTPSPSGILFPGSCPSAHLVRLPGSFGKNLSGSLRLLLAAMLWTGFLAPTGWTQTPSNTVTKAADPARVCIVLVQPEEDATVVAKDGVPLWKDPAPPGYGFGEWLWPGGTLNLTLKNPTRETITLNGTLAAGKCHMVLVSSKPNPDPKKAAQFPLVTTAQLVPLAVQPHGNGSLTYGISLSTEPLELQVNGKKTLLQPREPVLLGRDRVSVQSPKGETISCTEPADPCVLVLAYYRDQAGKILWINSRFF